MAEEKKKPAPKKEPAKKKEMDMSLNNLNKISREAFRARQAGK